MRKPKQDHPAYIGPPLRVARRIDLPIDDTILHMSALVSGTDSGIFAALKGAQLFQQVGIESSALTWPDGADLEPMAVHEEFGKTQPVFV